MTDSKDLTLTTPYGKFNFRVGYLVFSDNRIMLEKSPEGYWFMPGGRVAFNETTSEAIKREVTEELSIDITTCELAGFIENFFNMNGEDYHEISTYYRIELPEGFKLPTHEAGGKPIELAWHNFNSLKDLYIVPQFLTEKVPELHKGFVHLIQDDR